MTRNRITISRQSKEGMADLVRKHKVHVFDHGNRQGRQCHAIKITNGSNPGRPGICLLGGVHAREWGSPRYATNGCPNQARSLTRVREILCR
jgi:hypothetical protein